MSLRLSYSTEVLHQVRASTEDHFSAGLNSSTKPSTQVTGWTAMSTTDSLPTVTGQLLSQWELSPAQLNTKEFLPLG
jgi:hypothetical protein